MPMFEVVAGEHRHDDGMVYTAGDVIQSKHPLMAMFPNKFKKPAAGAKIAKGESAKEKKLVHVAYPGYDLGQESVIKQPVNEDEDDAPEEEEAPVKKPAKSKMKSTRSAVEEDENVTSFFAKAKKNDLVVLQGEHGFTVKDGDKCLTEAPLKSKQAVQEFLDDHLSDKE